MRLIKNQRLALVSPWVLAAACALLSLIITVFAVNNYRREKILMTDVLLERGATLIRFVTSGARASFLDAARRGLKPSGQLSDHVQEILERAAEQPGVHFLALVDQSGKILASSDTKALDSTVDPETSIFIDAISGEIHDLGRFRYRIGGHDQVSAFQVAALFVPIGKRQLNQQAQFFRGNIPGPEGIGRMMMRQHHPPPPEWNEELERISQQKYILLVELDMSEFKKAVRQQLLQIVILSVVLLLVGVGGWLSLLTLEGLKGSQSRLERIKAFRDTLISSLPVGLIVTDSQGLIILCNQFAERMTSVVEKDAVGLPPEEVLAPELAQALSGTAMPAEGSRREIILPDHNGGLRTLQLQSMSVVDSEGAPSGSMLLIQDLSQLKSLEEELRRSERMAALGKMAAGVAHELRNPLSSIKGLAILLRSKFQEKSDDQLTADILVQEVERLNRSISELLDYTRPQKLVLGDVHPVEVVRKAMSLVRMDAESMGVIMEIHGEEHIPVIQADQDKLNQVFLNLLLNSIQAMEHGGRLDIYVADDGRNITLKVKDTGCGVAKENLSRVFDPYFTTKPDGTGLGLAMSVKIIEEHGGTISFQSDCDSGTTVTVILPVLGSGHV